MTDAEFQTYLTQILPAIVKGIARPVNKIDTSLSFNTDFSQLIEFDPNSYIIFNAILTRLLSNDARLKDYTDQAITNLVNGSPSTLDTLNELSKALANDPNFATTMTNELAKKANITDMNTALVTKSNIGHTHTTSEIIGSIGFFKGMIIDFSGTFGGSDGFRPINPTTNLADQGWALCNGQNGTPDLRNRFVIGAGSTYAIGATGGEATHVLTVSEMPSHAHGASAWTDVQGNHAHTNYHPSGSSGGNNYGWYWSALGGGWMDLGTGAAGDHGHNVGVSIAANGSSAAHNNLPPYYALAQIMKL